MIGKVFTRLTVIEQRPSNKYRQKTWLCRCECGNELVVPTLSLNTGNTRSCGCYQKERSSELRLTHGLSKTRIYGIWNAMVNRCHNPKDNNWGYYGGKGISVCEEWRNDIHSFISWAESNGYRSDLTIDRKDGQRDYCPENCRWTTMEEQAQNKSNTRFTPEDISNIREDPRSLREIAEDYNVSITGISNIKAKKRWRNIR